MLNKFFKQKSVPHIQGKEPLTMLTKKHFKKVFELELSNMQETPVYPLTNQLSIGSEIGNIVIADPSISPRHATFTLQEEVVSVLDHGSVAGTFINNQKIQAGKTVLLEDTDTVRVGDLEVKIKSHSVEDTSQKIPEIPLEEEKEDVTEIANASLELEEPPVAIPTPKTKTAVAKKKVKKSSLNTSHSANAVVRVFSVVCDFLLSYSLLIILSPFDEFRSFLSFIPDLFLDSVDVNSLWVEFEKNYSFVAEVGLDIYKMISGSFDFVSLFMMFAVLRAITTLFLGVSISEFALGVRPSGNGIWARVGGFIRVIIGLVTGPFLIFDAPSIVSKRTFKELITYTNVELRSKFISILGFIFYIPLLLVLVLFSPLLQGLETPTEIAIDDKIDQRVKIKVQGDAAAELNQPVNQYSQRLNVEMKFDKNELNLIPNFRFQGVRSKLKVFSTMVLFQRDQGRFAELEVFKTFDLKQLLGLGIKGNVFLFDKYPHIYNFVYASNDSNPSFRKKIDSKSQALFASEFIRFTKTAFSLNGMNAFDLMQEETWLLKSFIDYKMSFLSLLEYKDYDSMGFIKIGNALFMKISYNKQKPFDLLIPLIEGEGKIFKISFDKKENLEQVSSKLYKFNLNDTNWFSEFNHTPSEVMDAFQVFDLFSGDNIKNIDIPEKAQALYGYYFEASAEVLKRNDSSELLVWKEKAMNLLKLLEALPPVAVPEGQENPRMKLIQNFRDLHDALENQNSEYFGIKEVQSV